MALRVVCGAWGVGKTAYLADRAYDAYKRGDLVITNFRFVYAHKDLSQAKDPVGALYDVLYEVVMFKMEGYETSDLLADFMQSGISIFVDEAHLSFSADEFMRYRTDEKFKRILQFLAQVRKTDVDIWLSVQQPGRLDKNWRRYVTEGCWIRLRYLIPITYKKLIPHKTKWGYRKEIRAPIPIIIQENHDLEADSPDFNLATMIDPRTGLAFWSPKATIVGRRRLRLAGWMNPFPYRLYSSMQILSTSRADEKMEYPILTSIDYIRHTMKPIKYLRFWNFWRKLLRRALIVYTYPTREKFDGDVRITLPESEGQNNDILIVQPFKTIEEADFFQQRRLRAIRILTRKIKYFRDRMEVSKGSDGEGSLIGNQTVVRLDISQGLMRLESVRADVLSKRALVGTTQEQGTA